MVDGIFSQLKPHWRVWVFILSLACLLLFATSQKVFSEQPPPSQPAKTQPASKGTLSEDLQRLTDRVLQLELDLAKPSQSPQGTNLAIIIIPALATLGAALVAGIFAFLTQHYMAKREERRAILTAERELELARLEALFQHGEKFLEFRLKQMGLFYAPMFALLKQSKALYDKMSLQLVSDDPDRYQLRKTDDSNEPRLYVCTGDEKDKKWEEFRLLDQLPAVRANPGILALVERIILIGEQMTKIISEHAGLALEDLVDLLGEYLAHHAILSMIYKEGETNAYKPGAHEMGYFPRELPKKIIQGYNEISAHLKEYEKKTKQVLETFPEKNGEKGA